MLIDQLERNNVAILEIVSEDHKFEIISHVAGSSADSVLLEPVIMSSELSGIDPRKLKDVVFNLYADAPDGNRIGWFNLNVKSVEYGDRRFLGVFTRAFNRNSKPTDRRGNERLRVDDVMGMIETKDGEVQYYPIYDMSNVGISFLAEDAPDFLNKRLAIRIEETLHHEKYNFKVNCTCIRSTSMDGKTLFGCSVGESERRYLLYLSEKRLEMRRDGVESGMVSAADIMDDPSMLGAPAGEEESADSDET